MADDAAPRMTIAGNLPTAPDNGFDSSFGELIAGSMGRKRYITVTVWEVRKTTIDHGNGNAKSVLLGVVSVEPILNDTDAQQALAMHDRAHGDRTGEVTLGAVAEPASSGGDGDAGK
jgi:hypothetical protein